MGEEKSVTSSRSGAERIADAIAAAGDNDLATSESAVALLRAVGALAAAAPASLGGLGLGVEAAGARGLFTLLCAFGRRDLSMGRLFEGHVNALQLVCRYGSESLRREAARDAIAGHLFAIWVTEAPPGVRRGAEDRLTGKKSFCSAAGLATRAVITIDMEGADGGQMALVRLALGERVEVTEFAMHGMRAARTGAIDFTGYRLDPESFLGQRGDYMREPVFSGGAWRALAVLLGGLERLADECFRQLRASHREAAPAQRGRIADIVLSVETARLWVSRCADLLEANDYRDRAAAFYVGIARLAFERAAYAALQDAQRCVGLASLAQSNPLERLMRDLTTYLRQPALDAAVEEAAAWLVANPLPPLRCD